MSPPSFFKEDEDEEEYKEEPKVFVGGS